MRPARAKAAFDAGASRARVRAVLSTTSRARRLARWLRERMYIDWCATRAKRAERGASALKSCKCLHIEKLLSKESSRIDILRRAHLALARPNTPSERRIS